MTILLPSCSRAGATDISLRALRPGQTFAVKAIKPSKALLLKSCC